MTTLYELTIEHAHNVSKDVANLLESDDDLKYPKSLGMLQAVVWSLVNTIQMQEGLPRNPTDF